MIIVMSLIVIITSNNNDETKTAVRETSAKLAVLGCTRLYSAVLVYHTVARV